MRRHAWKENREELRAKRDADERLSGIAAEHAHRQTNVTERMRYFLMNENSKEQVMRNVIPTYKRMLEHFSTHMSFAEPHHSPLKKAQWEIRLDTCDIGAF